MAITSAIRPLYIAFEDHFLDCKICTLSGCCEEGQRLRTAFNRASAARTQAGGDQPATTYSGKGKKRK